MTKMIFIGSDQRELEAYDVAVHSIRRRSKAVSCCPLGLKTPYLDRPIERRDGKLWCPISNAPMATEFAISRFCVPFLFKNHGWALFVDCDIVCLADIAELFALADPQYAVICVKHEQRDGARTKMDGQVQLFYARKNWSSVVLWNCDHPAHDRFTLEHLNSWPGRDLHAFKWLTDEEIGELPPNWNYLVDVNPRPDPIKIAHFTLGGPWFPDWKGGSCDDIWLAERKDMLNECDAA